MMVILKSELALSESLILISNTLARMEMLFPNVSFLVTCKI